MSVNVDNYSCLNSSIKKNVPNVINKRYVRSFVRNVRIVTVWNVKLSIFMKRYASISIKLSKHIH